LADRDEEYYANTIANPPQLVLPTRIKAREPRGLRHPKHTKIMRILGVRARSLPTLSSLALNSSTRFRNLAITFLQLQLLQPHIP
jgi:hypothetical protein